jgi:hypothetical protein
MRRWRDQFVSNVIDEAAFFNELRTQRRADRHRHPDIVERELVNPNMTWGDDDDRWDDSWTETTSDDE